MTIEAYIEAHEKVKEIKQCEEKIALYTRVMEKQVGRESAYDNDQIMLEIHNGRDSNGTCYVPRYLVKDMLESCVCLYQTKKEELERELASI